MLFHEWFRVKTATKKIEFAYLLQYENTWGGSGFGFRRPHCYSLFLSNMNEHLKHQAEKQNSLNASVHKQRAWVRRQRPGPSDTGRENIRPHLFRGFLEISCWCVTKSKCLRWNPQITNGIIQWEVKQCLFSMWLHWNWLIFRFSGINHPCTFLFGVFYRLRAI